MSNDSNRKDDRSQGGEQSAPGAPQGGGTEADDRHKGRPGERPETDPDKRREGGASQAGHGNAGRH